MESGHGKQIKNEIMKLLCVTLKIDQRFHYSNRTEPSSILEQIKGTLHSKMATLYASTSLKLPNALLLVLMSF